jgi:hypothetical protein
MLPGLVSITKGGCGEDDDFSGRDFSAVTVVAAASVNIAEVLDRRGFGRSHEHVASVNNIPALRANRCIISGDTSYCFVLSSAMMVFLFGSPCWIRYLFYRHPFFMKESIR